MKIMTERGYALITTAEREIVRDIKEEEEAREEALPRDGVAGEEIDCAFHSAVVCSLVKFVRYCLISFHTRLSVGCFILPAVDSEPCIFSIASANVCMYDYINIYLSVALRYVSDSF